MNRDLTDQNLCWVFRNTGDLIRREIGCCGLRLYVYMLDGMVSSSAVSEYVLMPLVRGLRGDSQKQIFNQALQGAAYNAVAESCRDLTTCAMKLMNGYCIVCFPEWALQHMR